MAPSTASITPSLPSFLRTVSSEPVETSIEHFVALVKRRQIRGAKSCAIATAFLLRRTVSSVRTAESHRLLSRVQEVGRRLIHANPKELVIGNIVRRVLGLIRDELDDQHTKGDLSSPSSEPGSIPATPGIEFPTSIPLATPNGIPSSRDFFPPTAERPPLPSSNTTSPPRPPMTSMFSILSHPTMRSPSPSSPKQQPTAAHQASSTDLRAEVLEGISELIDELDSAPDQIAPYSLDHISPSETVLTYSCSSTVQKFLLHVAKRRKFTLFHAESYPNNHKRTHAVVTGNHDGLADEDRPLSTDAFTKPLTRQGVQVVLIPDNAIFAIMPRCTKVLLSASSVFTDGSFIADAGTSLITKSARVHRTPVIVLAATYKLSPLYPHDQGEYVEYGDVSKVVEAQDGELRQGLKQLRNPVHDVVSGHDVQLFVTNLGGVGAAGVARVTRGQYREEDFVL